MSGDLADLVAPALTFEGMIDLVRGLVALTRAQAVLVRQLGCDAETCPTVLSLRAAQAALEFTAAEEVPPEELVRIGKIILAQYAEAGHA